MVRVRAGFDPESLTTDEEVEYVVIEANGEPIGRFDAGEVNVQLGPRPEPGRQVVTGDEAESGEGSG